MRFPHNYIPCNPPHHNANSMLISLPCVLKTSHLFYSLCCTVSVIKDWQVPSMYRHPPIVLVYGSISTLYYLYSVNSRLPKVFLPFLTQIFSNLIHSRFLVSHSLLQSLCRKVRAPPLSLLSLPQRNIRTTIAIKSSEVHNMSKYSFINIFPPKYAKISV